MDIHTIIELLGSGPADVSNKFNIPLRTVYGWCKGDRTPPDYVIRMMFKIIMLEQEVINGDQEKGLEERMGRSPEGIKETCQKSKSKISKA